VGKSWKVEIYNLNRDVFVPLSISTLEKNAPGERPNLHWDRITVPAWWARAHLADLLAMQAAGPARRAPGAFTVRPVAPARNDGTGAAFVDYADGSGEFVQLKGQPVYLRTTSAHEFAFARKEADLRLRDAATLLGLRPSEISGLESGSLEFTEPEMWTKAMQAMDAEGQRRRPKRAEGEKER
jgi:hypothetical protein